MKSIITAIVLTCLFTALFLSCGTSEKPAQYATLTGRVTAADTTVYLSGVKVFTTDPEEKSVTTDSAGFFRLEFLPFEEQFVYFEKEGYRPDSLVFAYDGNLERPIVTYHVILNAVETEE